MCIFYLFYKSGGAFNLLYTNNKFYYTNFNDNISGFQGGSLNIKFSNLTTINTITFRNSTSYQAVMIIFLLLK